MRGQVLNNFISLRTRYLSFDLRQMARVNRKAISFVLAIVVILSTGLVAVIPSVTSASETNVIQNGGFEHGFSNINGCGVVGAGWNCFTNGGSVNYGFYDDQWEPVVAEGKNSQLIEISTKGFTASESDRYAGISQTVRVMKNSKYTFSMRGMIRTTDTDGADPWRYVVEVGWAEGPNAHWKDVQHWTDTGWYTYYPRTEPGHMGSFRTSLMPESDTITIFVRVWKKWGVPNQELDVNLDAIELVGPSYQMMADDKNDARRMMSEAPATQAIVVQPEMPMQPPTWSGGTGGSCQTQELLFNGNFENGFLATGYGEVGRGWGPFTNGGAANYGFYDEQWDAVISMADRSSWSCNSNKSDDMGCGCGSPCNCDEDNECTGNGQLIEINTKNMFPADADRYAGIYQRIGGLTPGEVYTLSLRGLLRGTGDEADKYRFAAQWGINSGADTDRQHVGHWEEMNLGPIYPRTEPGPLASYRSTFKAPSSQVVIFIRAWNKWSTSGVELDFNLDDISLTGCGMTGGSSGSGGSGAAWVGGTPSGQGGAEPIPQVTENQGNQCTYTVAEGDTLGTIALWYDVDVSEITAASGISDPNVIYVGQELTIPDCSGAPALPNDSQSRMQQPVPVVRPQTSVEPSPMITPSDRPVPNIRGVPMTPVVESVESVVAITSDVSSSSYTVRPGQSLGQIAVENGVDPYALAMANGISNMDVLYIGQVLRIP